MNKEKLQSIKAQLEYQYEMTEQSMAMVNAREINSILRSLIEAILED